MGLFDLLFGKKRNDSQKIQDRKNPLLTFIGEIAEIKSIGFYGHWSKSPSGEWVICWIDRDINGSKGGFRDSGKGAYALYNAALDKVVQQGRLERPNGGNVADNGTFSLEDLHFGNELSGTFFVISADGRVLVSRKFDANIFNSAISKNGRFAICQTLNAPSAKDSFKLTAFDVENKVELFSIDPPTGLADEYKINEETQKFGVLIKGVGTHCYDLVGNLINPDKFELAKLRGDNYASILLAVEEVLKSKDLSEKRATAALEAAIRALSLGADKDQGWKAISLKSQGLAHEFLGNYEAAIVAYESAMLLNPKIGVKRKADLLKKKIGK